jgi:hypothetical protein
MKPSVKPSLPIGVILFASLLLIVVIVQRSLDSYRPEYVPDGRPNLQRSMFTSDGSLCHLATSSSPGGDVVRFWVYDESLSARREVSKDERNRLWNKTLYFTPVHPQAADWWARRVWHCPETLIWWNGPEGQFDVYDKETRLRSESLGPDGGVTRAPARPNGRFRLVLAENPKEYSMNGVTTYLFITEDGVLRLNPGLRALGAERLFKERVDSLSWGADEQGKIKRLHLISGGTLWKLDLQGPPSRMVSLPDPLVQAILAGNSFVIPLDNGNYSVETHMPHQWPRETMFLLNSDGHVLRRVELDEDDLSLRIRGAAYTPWKNPILTIRPLLLPSLKLPFWPYPLSLPPLLERELTTTAMVQSIILSLVLAGLVAGHQVWTGRRGWRVFAWPAFTLAAGPAGAAAYAIAHWGKRTEACPGCGKRRPISQDTCPHCNIPWPKPAKSGFEVLEAH